MKVSFKAQMILYLENKVPIIQKQCYGHILNVNKRPCSIQTVSFIPGRCKIRGELNVKARHVYPEPEKDICL